jgi:DNA-binding NarL/FixJ family response regulator
MKTLDLAVATVALGRAFFGDRILQAFPAIVGADEDAESHKLTARQREVLALVADGATSKEVAGKLGISIRTVGNHRQRIMDALGARNTSDLTREAIRLGLLSVACPESTPTFTAAANRGAVN